MKNFTQLCTWLSLTVLISLSLPLSLRAQTGPGGAGNNSTANDVIWYRADVISSNPANGDVVSTWDDQFGAAANDASSGGLPVFNTNVINGQPAMLFDGSNDVWLIGDATELNSGGSPYLAKTIFIMLRTGSDVSSRQVVFEQGGGSRGLNIYIDGGNVYMGMWNDVDDDGGATTPWPVPCDDAPTNCSGGFASTGISANTNYVFEFRYSHDGSDAQVGEIVGVLDFGTFQTISTGIGRLYDAADNIGLGRTAETTTYHDDQTVTAFNNFGGHIAEFIYFNRELSAIERTQIENYLAAKYAQTLGADFYAGDDGGNGDFDYDVTGIGQVSGVSATAAEAGGVVLNANGAFADGEYAFAGHDNTATGTSTADVPAGVEERMARSFYIDKTTSADLDITIGFDFAVLTGASPITAADYRLLYRATNSGNFSEVTTTGASISGDQLLFDVADANFADGYYTAGTIDATDNPLDAGIVSITSGAWNSTATWSCACVPGAADNVTIVSPHTVTLTDDRTITNVSIATGGTLAINNNDRLTVQGNLSINGSIDLEEAGTPEVDLTMTGAGAELSGTGSIFTSAGLNNNSSPIVTIAADITIPAGTDLTVTQNDADNEDYFRINSGVTVTNNGTIRFNENLTGQDGTATWVNGSGGRLEVEGVLLSTGVLTANATDNTVAYTGLVAQSIKTTSDGSYYNLEVSGSDSKTLAAATTILNDLNISATLEPSGFDISIGGDWTNTGVYNDGAEQVSFNGTGTQTISSALQLDLYDLVIQKSGGTFTSNVNIVATNSLTMDNVLIDMGSNKLTLGTSISNPGTYTRVAPATVIGRFERWVNGSNATNLELPVGTASNYNGVSITFNTLTDGSLIAEFINSTPGRLENAPLDDNGVDINNTYPAGYWSLSKDNGLESTDYDLDLTANGFSFFTISADTRILFRANSASEWSVPGTHVSAGFVTPVVQRDAFTSLSGEFALGENDNCVYALSSSISGNTVVCASDAGETYTVDGPSGSNYSWSVTGGTITSASSGVGLTSITIDWDGTGQVAEISVIEDNTITGGCGAGEAVTLDVQIDALPTSDITGSTSVSVDASGVTYSVENTSGYSYTWAITGGGGTIASGQGTNAITVDWGATPGNYNVAVSAQAGAPCSALASDVTLAVTVFDVIESVQTGDWNVSTTWEGGNIPGAGESARINDSHVVTLTDDRTVQNLEITSAGELVIQNNDRLTIEGNLTIDGLLDSEEQGTPEVGITMTGNGGILDGTGSVLFSAGKNNNNSPIFTFDNNITIAATADLSFSQLDADNPDYFRVNSNSIVTNYGSITLNENLTGENANATWINAAGSSLTVGGSLLSTGTLNASATDNTVTYNGGAAQTIKDPLNSTYYNLRLSGSGAKSIQASTTISGDLTFSSTLNSNGFDINLGGDWTSTGLFTEGTNTVTLEGTGTQTISSTISEEFYNLSISKNGSTVTLASNVQVDNNLVMENCLIETGSFMLTLGSGISQLGTLTRTAPATIIGAFERWVNTSNQTGLLFPVGTSSSYRPLSITFNNLNAGSLIATFEESNPGVISTAPLDDNGLDLNNNFPEGYWTLTRDNSLSSNDYDLSLTATGFSSFTLDNDTRIVTRANSSSNWDVSGTHDAASFGASTVHRDNISTLSAEYALAVNDNCSFPTTTAITGNTDVCINDSGEAYSTTGTAGSTFTWTVTGGTIVGSASGVDLTAITVDWGSTGQVGQVTVTEDNTAVGGCGEGTPQTLDINIGPVPTSAITGNTTSTTSSTGVAYSVTETAGYTYTWSVSGSGGTIASGQGTASVTIDWGSTEGNYTVSVSAQAPAPCSQTAADVTLDVSLIDVIESVQTGTWNVSTTWEGGVIPSSGTAARINTTHTVTLTDDRSVQDLEIAEGGQLTINNNDLLTIEGNLTINGVLESEEQGTPEANVRMTGDGGILDGTGSIVFTAGLNNNNSAIFFFDNNTTIAASAVLSFDITDADAPDFVEVNDDVIVTNNGAISLNENLAGGNGNSTWINAAGSSLTIGGDVMRTGVLNAAASTNTVTYNGTADQTITAPLGNDYGNLVLSGSGTKTMESALNVQGNITISSTFAVSGFDLSVGGNWTNSGNFTEGTQLVTFNGTADQTLSSALDEVFYDLDIAKGTGDLILANNVTVSNSLTLSAGNINTGANVLTLGTSTANLGTLSVSSPAHIIGSFERWVNTSNQSGLVLPVGSGSDDQSITMTFNNLVAGSIVAEFVSSDPGSAGLPLTDGAETLNNQFFTGYWTLTAANSLSTTDYDLSLEAGSFDGNPFSFATGHIVVRANSASSWTIDGTHVAPSGSTAARTNITTLSAEYGIASTDNCTVAATASISGEGSPCIGDSETYTAVGGNAGSTYTWTVTGGTIDGGVATGAGLTSINVTWGSAGGTGTITVVENNNFDPVFGCGDGALVSLDVAINPVPTSAITGASSVSIDLTGSAYSVDNNTGYTYTWTLPEGGTIVSGDGTNAITIDWGSNPGTYTLTVSATAPAPCSQTAEDVSISVTVLDEIRSVQTGDWNVATTWEDGIIPSASDNARIQNTHTVTLTDDRTVTNLVIDEGGQLTTNNNDLLTIQGDFTINGVYESEEQGTPEPNILMNGDGAILDGTGVINYTAGKNNNNGRIFVFGNNITIASTANLTFTQSDADNPDMIELSNDVIVTNNGSISLNYNIYGANTNATWVNAAGGSLTIGGSLMATGTLDASATGNTITYNGNSAQTIKTASDGYYNLSLSGSAAKSLEAATSAAGDIAISSEFALSGFNFTLEGNWNNTGTFTPGTNSVIFFGTNDQTITNASGESFYGLSLNKSLGSLVLANNVEVTTSLSMSEGIVETGGNTLTLGTNAITEGTLSHTNGRIVGNFERYVNSASAFLFPVGTDTDYRPLTLSFDGLSSGGSLLVSFAESAPGSAGLPLTDGAVTIRNTFSEGYWSVGMPNTVTFTTYDIDLTGNGFNSFVIDADTRVLSRTSSAGNWVANGTHVAASGVVAQRDDISTLPLEFALGDDTDCDLPTTSAITRTVAGSNCADDTGVQYQVTNTPGSVYNWTVAGGTITSGQGTNIITITWGSTGGTYTISVTEDNSAISGGCGVGTPVTLDVDVNPLPTSAISGRTSVAAGTTGESYTVDNTTGYTYAWTVSGGTIASGDGTNTITVDWGATGSGSVSVIATNTDCGLSAAAVTLDPIDIFAVITSNGIGGGDWNVGASWTGGAVPQSTNSVQILSGDEIVLTDDRTIDNIIIDAGGLLTINNNDRLAIDGDFTLNGAVESEENGTPEANIRMDGAGGILDGTGTFTTGINNLNNNNAAIFYFNANTTIASTADLTFTQNDGDNPGFVQINNNVTVTNNGSVTINENLIGGGSNATWINAANSSLTIGNTLLSTGILFANQTGNTVEYNRAGAQSIKNPSGGTYTNLTLSGSGNKSLQAATTVSTTLNNSATLLANGFNITMRGAWINTGTFTPGTNSVTFNGTGAQSITNAAGEVFYTLIVNSNGGSLTLNNDVQATNALTLTLGNVITGANTLTLGTSTPTEGTLTRSSGAVNGNFERYINSTATEFLWPLTDGTNYLPVEITFNSLNASGPLTGSFNSGDPGSTGLPVTDGAAVVEGAFSDGYWEFSTAGAFSSTDYNIDITANGFSSFTIDPTGLSRLIARAAGAGTWLDPLPGTHVNGTGNEVQRDNADQDFPAEFGLGDLTACPTIVTSAITGATEVCNSSTEAYSVSLTGGSTYNWFVTGGTIDESGTDTYAAADADISVTWDATGGERIVRVVEEITCSGLPVYGDTVLLDVNVNPIPAGPIAGNFDLATGAIGQTYSVFNRTGYSYQWTTSDGTITSSSTANSVTVDWTTTNTTGNLRLTITYDDAVAVCGAAQPDEVIDSTINFYDVISSVNSGDWDDPNTWICTCVPDNNADVSISNTTTVTLVDNSVSVADLIIDAGSIFDNAGFGITVNRDYTNNGTHQGTGTTTLRGNLSLITGSGSKTAGILRASDNDKSFDAATNMSLGGTLQIGSSVDLTNNGILTITGTVQGDNSTSATLINASLATLNINSTGATLMGTAGRLEVSAANNTVNYNAAGDQTIKTPNGSPATYWNLQVAGSGNKSLASNVAVTNLIIDGGAFAPGSNTLSVSGNWTNNNDGFTETNSTVNFNGSAAQTVSNVTNTETFHNLTLNHSSDVTSNGVSPAGGNTMVVSNQLTLTDGYIIATPTEIFRMGAGSSVVLNASTDQSESFIVGPMQYEVAATGPTTMVLPIGGTDIHFHRADVTVSHDATTSTIYTAEYIQGDANGLGSSSGLPNAVEDIQDVSKVGYWDIAKGAGAGLTSATATFYYTQADGVLDFTNLRMVKADNSGTAWTNVGGTGSGNIDGTITTDPFTSFSIFATANAIGGTNPLPVELVYFTGELDNSSVLLDWATASETNNDFFTIEKSADGLVFETLANVPGAGNSTRLLEYSFTDLNPYVGNNYYRIKQTDYDGTSSYSGVVLVQYLSEEVVQYKVFPNPTYSDRFITALVGLLPDQEVQVWVSDMAGRRYMEQSFRADLSGKVYESLDFPGHAPAGTYVVHIETNGFRKNVRLVKK